MNTPAMKSNPIAAVTPATPQRPAAATGQSNRAEFGNVLAREVSQHDARLKDTPPPDDKGAATAAPAAESPPADTVPAKADGANDTAQAGTTTPDDTAQAGTTTPDPTSADPTPNAGLLALVTGLNSKADTARAPDATAVPPGIGAGRAAARGDLAGIAIATPTAADDKAVGDVQALQGRSIVAGVQGQLKGDGFAAALGRIAADSAKGENARVTTVPDVIPDPALRAPTTPAMPIAAAMAIPVTDRLAPRVGAAGWDNALGQRMVWMAGAQEQTASLTLNPPDLGPLQVVLSVSNNQADAMFVATQPEVRQALEAAMPRLREMLGEAGVTLREATVSADTRDSQQAFHQGQRNGGGSRESVSVGTAADPRMSRMSVGGGRSLVDTFA